MAENVKVGWVTFSYLWVIKNLYAMATSSVYAGIRPLPGLTVMLAR